VTAQGEPTDCVDVPGGRLPVWRSGAGEPMVLLHGGPAANDYLESILPELDGFEAIRYQQRSIAPAPLAGPFTVEQHLADLEALLDALALDRPWLLGHSWGGHLALHALVALSGRFAAAVIVDPLGAIPEEPGVFEAMLRRDLTKAARARLAELDEREAAGTMTTAESLESLGIIWRNYHHDREHPPPMVLTDINLPAFAATMASVGEHLATGTLRERLPRVDTAVVFVHGASSPLDRSHSTDSAAFIPNATVVVVEEAGHFPWLERPGSVAEAIEALRRPARPPVKPHPLH
jgi:pimeloyl-ACP methyl ester carboxylesterase